MYLTNFPRFVPVSAYDFAIERMVGKLRQQDGVTSIFQVGSINNPGISDIDMLVVFEDGVRCGMNPLEDLSQTERYLFSHSLYGVSRGQFYHAQKHALFHNYNLLWGDEIPIRRNDLSQEQTRKLKTQIALEYLIKMFVNSTVECVYGIVRVRGLLVLVKALSYDLEFLNVSSGRLFDLVQRIIDWRNNWFEDRPDKQTFKKWFREFYAELTAFLKATLQTRAFYLPDWVNLRIAKNMTFVASKELGYRRKGIALPAILGDLGRKYFNVQHRFNKFHFQIPITTSKIPCGLPERFSFMKNISKENDHNLPYFMPLTSSLNIFWQT